MITGTEKQIAYAKNLLHNLINGVENNPMDLGLIGEIKLLNETIIKTENKPTDGLTDVKLNRRVQKLDNCKKEISDLRNLMSLENYSGPAGDLIDVLVFKSWKYKDGTNGNKQFIEVLGRCK